MTLIRCSALLGVALSAGISFAGSGEQAELVVFTTQPAASRENTALRPPALRRYEVREDPKSGRLVRKASRWRGASAPVSEQAGARTSRKKVVQGPLAGLPASGVRGPVDIDAIVQSAGRRYGVDPRWIHAVIRQESGYDVFAVSRKGACGLMQLMPETAGRFGVQNIFDPAENVEGGVKYLRHLLDRYDGDPALALAAYNAGEGAVDYYGGIPPYRETSDFVGRVSRFYGPAHGSVSSGLIEGASEPGERRRIVKRVEPSGLITFEME